MYFDDSGFGKEPTGGGDGRGEKRRRLVNPAQIRPGEYYVDANENEWNVGATGSDEKGPYIMISRSVTGKAGESGAASKKIHYGPTTKVLVVEKY